MMLEKLPRGAWDFSVHEQSLCNSQAMVYRMHSTLLLSRFLLPCAGNTFVMHLQDKTMQYLLSSELEQVQRTHRASVVLGNNYGSTLLKTQSPNTSVRTMGLLISPFTAPLCTLPTNFNGGSWVRHWQPSTGKTLSICHSSSTSTQLLSHLSLWIYIMFSRSAWLFLRAEYIYSLPPTQEHIILSNTVYSSPSSPPQVMSQDWCLCIANPC